MTKGNTQGRAVGAVGPGDVKKLEQAGLTVVDTKAYQLLGANLEKLLCAIDRLEEQLNLADDVVKEARKHCSLDGALAYAVRAYEEARKG